MPLLVGYASGATVVYATLAQAPPGTFAERLAWASARMWILGALPRSAPRRSCATRAQKGALVFEPEHRPPSSPGSRCKGRRTPCAPHRPSIGLSRTPVAAPWCAYQGSAHGFSVERNWLHSSSLSTRTCERPEPSGGTGAGDSGSACHNGPRARERDGLFALLLTGEGGWAGLDRELAAHIWRARRVDGRVQFVAVLLAPAQPGGRRRATSPASWNIFSPLGRRPVSFSLAAPLARTLRRSSSTVCPRSCAGGSLP